MRNHGAGIQITAVLCLGGSLLAALFVRPFLPEQFVRDDEHIRRALIDPTATDATSFRAIAGLYRALGLDQAAPLAALLGVTVFVIAVFAAIGWKDLAHMSWIGLALLAPTTAIAVVYLGQFSKELVTVAVATAVLLLPRTPGGEIGVVVLCLLYGATLRPYWLLIAVAYVALGLLLRRRSRLRLLLPAVLAGYAVLALVFPLHFDGGGLESQREWINAERADATVDTLITGPFPEATGLLSVLSVLVVLGMLMVPLPLLASGDPEHMAAALLITTVWVLVLRRLLLPPPAEAGRAAAGDPAAPAVTPAVTATSGRAATLLLAVLVVQALFEPDYGSYLKHLAGLLPMALALVPLQGTSQVPDGPGTSSSGPVGPTRTLVPARTGVR